MRVDRRAVEVLARHLELCRVTSGRPATVLFDDTTDPVLVDTAISALEQVGTRPAPVCLDDVPPDAGLTMPDIVVNLTGSDPHSDMSQSRPPQSRPPQSSPPQSSPSQSSMASEGLIPSNPQVLPSARVLSVIAPTAALRDIVPHAGLGRRTQRGLHLLDSGQELHVFDDKGTNLRVGLAGARRWLHDGLATAAGQVAQWPRGIIGSAPAPRTARGKVVMSPGDIWLPMGWYARSSVALKFDRGRIVSVDGPPSETDAIRAHLASLGSAAAYRLDAVEIGLLWVDRPRPPALFEPCFAESFGVADRYGHVVIATGDHPMVGIACCLRNATVAVDEVAAVRSGQPQGDLAPDVYEQAAHRFSL